MNLKDLMFSHGWKVHVEDYDGTLFIGQLGGHTDSETMLNILHLGGYEATRHPSRAVPYLFVYPNEPMNP